MSLPPWMSMTAGAVEVEVFAVPRASRSRIVGVHDNRLKVQLAAPPADGEANAALLLLFRERLGLKGSAVMLASGHGQRKKRVRLEGVSAAEVLALVEGVAI